MATHLGYEKHDQEAKPNGNRRNGKSKKTLKGEFGEIEVITPRDREATFEPQIIPKGQTRMAGLDGKILSMYAKGTIYSQCRRQNWLIERYLASHLACSRKRSAGDPHAEFCWTAQP